MPVLSIAFQVTSSEDRRRFAMLSHAMPLAEGSIRRDQVIVDALAAKTIQAEKALIVWLAADFAVTLTIGGVTAAPLTMKGLLVLPAACSAVLTNPSSTEKREFVALSA